MSAGRGFFASTFTNAVSKKDINIIKELAALQSKLSDKDNAALKLNQELSKSWSGMSVAARESAKAYIDSGRSLDILSASLNKTSVASKLVNGAMSLMSGVITGVVSIAIATVVEQIARLITFQNELDSATSEFVSSFNAEKESLDGYKTEIESLNEIIHSSSSSITEVTNARLDLMSVQDEMIQKYVSEGASIDVVTRAVNGQTEAWEELAAIKWNEQKRNFEQTGGLIGDASDWFGGYGSHTEAQLDRYRNFSNSINLGDLAINEDTYELLDKTLSKYSDFQNISYKDGVLSISGNATDAYEEILELQKELKKNDGEIGLQFSDMLVSVADEAKAIHDAVYEFNKLYVANEEIANNADYSKGYKEIQKAYSDYQDAVLSNDSNATQAAADELASTIISAYDTAMANGDDAVADYLRNMYPVLEKEISSWVFRYKIEPTMDQPTATGTSLGNATTNLTNAGYGVDALKGFANGGLIPEDVKADYDVLKKAADDAGISVEHLIDALAEQGHVLPDVRIELEKTFGKENIDKLTPDEIEIGYSIAPEGMSFEEFRAEIKSIQREQLAPKAFSREEMIGQINSLSEGYEALDKIMASIKDKDKAFDFALLDDKTFKETFSGLDSYDEFIETITDSPKDIEACQGAFDDLVTEWMNADDVLLGLTEDNAALTEQYLTLMGVTNAHEVVMGRLAAANEYAEATGEELAKATDAEIVAFINSGQASEEAKKAMAEYALQRLKTNGVTLTTDGDIQNIMALVDACGDGIIALQALAKARQGMAESEANLKLAQQQYNAAIESGQFNNWNYQRSEIGKYKSQVNAYQKEIDALTEAALAEVNEASTPFGYGGGNSANNTSSGGSGGGGGSQRINEKQQKQFDWMERMLEVIANKHKDIQDIIDDETVSMEAQRGQISNLIALDKQKEDVLKSQIEVYRTAWMDAINEISEEQLKMFSESGMDKKGLIEAISNGTLLIDEFTLPEGASDETKEGYDTLISQIENAQGAYSDMDECEEELDETEKEIAQHQKERFESRIEQIQSENDALKDRQSLVESDLNLLESSGGVEMENMYEELIRLSKNQIELYEEEIEAARDRMDEVSEGSTEYYQLKSQIYDCEAAINDAKAEQAEWNETIARLPIERIEKYLNELRNIKTDLENFISEQDSLTIPTSKEQYQQLIGISQEEIAKLIEQQGKLKDLLSKYDYGSEKYNEVSSEIQSIDDEISSLIQSQNEWNKAILELPIRNAEKLLSSLDNAKTDLQNKIDEQNAQGIDTTVDQYMELFNISTKQIEALKQQKEMLIAIQGECDKNSEAYYEYAGQIQDVENQMSQLIQSQYEYNKAILQIPVDKLADVNEQLSLYSSALGGVISDYDATLSAVNGVLDEQIKLLNEQREATEELYAEKIDPIQDELTALQETNEARRIQLGLEQAQYDLERARNQKTNQVVRDGELVYEADQDAIRDADQAYQDALYNKKVWELETEIDRLEKERDEILEGLDKEIDRLDDIKTKWSEITDQIKLYGDILKANEILGEGWQDKIMSGNDADLLNQFKDFYEKYFTEKTDVDNQIESNNRISEMMTKIAEQYQNGTLSYDEAMKAITDLVSSMEGGYSYLEQLNAIMGMNGVGNVGDIAGSTDKDITDIVNSFKDYLAQANKNNATTGSNTSSWQSVSEDVKKQVEALQSVANSLSGFDEFIKLYQSNTEAISKYTASWEEMQKSIADQMEALKKAAEELAKAVANQKKYHSSSSSGGGGGSSSGGNSHQNGFVAAGPGFSPDKLQDAINRGDNIIFDGAGSDGSGGSYTEDEIRDMVEDMKNNKYHGGLERGAIGGSDSELERMMKSLGLEPFKNNEVPILAQKGEFVVTPDQARNIIGNAQKPVSMAPQNNSSVSNRDVNVEVNMGDIILPDVTDPDQFAKALGSNFESAINQKFSAVFKK